MSDINSCTGRAEVLIGRLEPRAIRLGDEGDAAGDSARGFVLQLHVRDHRRIGQLVNGLALALCLLLELLNIAEGIHRDGAAVGVVAVVSQRGQMKGGSKKPRSRRNCGPSPVRPCSK
jgi:hypothetical protein